MEKISVEAVTLKFNTDNDDVDVEFTFNTELVEAFGHTIEDFCKALDEDRMMEFANYVFDKLKGK